MENTGAQTKRTLVLFDFDGTLTRGDTLFRFLIFSVPPLQLLSGAVILIFKYLLLVLRGNPDKGKAKELLFRSLFRNMPEDKMVSLGIAYFQQLIPLMLKQDMVQLMRSYKQSGATVAVVSASADIWLMPFCNFEQIECICTRLHFEQGVFSGNIQGENCNGPEKARRIAEKFDLKSFDRIIAYGNSQGDRAMLALATEPHRV